MEEIFHEIVKYSPSGYNKNGIYISNDWCSISDIGKNFNGNILSVDDYLNVEDKYINTILSIMQKLDCTYLTIEYVESDKNDIINGMRRYKEKYNVDILDSFPYPRRGMRFSKKKLTKLFRLCLRELCYIVFVCKSKKIKLYFSYEYYLNVKCPLAKDILYQIVNKNGLYLDPRG